MDVSATIPRMVTHHPKLKSTERSALQTGNSAPRLDPHNQDQVTIAMDGQQHFALYHGFISSMSCIPYFCTLCKLCMVSILTFILRKSKKGIFSPLASKRFLGTHSKYQMQVCNKILETCPPHVHQKVCGGQVE